MLEHKNFMLDFPSHLRRIHQLNIVADDRYLRGDSISVHHGNSKVSATRRPNRQSKSTETNYKQPTEPLSSKINKPILNSEKSSSDEPCPENSTIRT